jgi:hypothetical protein
MNKSSFSKPMSSKPSCRLHLSLLHKSAPFLQLASPALGRVGTLIYKFSF